MKKRIAIAMGGFSAERPISLKSADTVYRHLDPVKYQLYKVDIDRSGWSCEFPDGRRLPVDRSDFTVADGGNRIAFDAVFNCIHGTPGEDGILAAYWELLGIPQTSCGAFQAGLTFNKWQLLTVAERLGIATARSLPLDRNTDFDAEEIVKSLGLPVFVKANRSGSSIGIYKVKDEEGLEEAIEKAFEVDTEVLVESQLEGTEVSVGVIPYLGSLMVLPMTEIVSENEFFDYEAKYEGKSEEITPARISDETRLQIAEQSLTLYRRLKLNGFVRSEFIIADGVPYLLEINTTPGLTGESILPQQALKAGISLDKLFESALEPLLD